MHPRRIFPDGSWVSADDSNYWSSITKLVWRSQIAGHVGDEIYIHEFVTPTTSPITFQGRIKAYRLDANRKFVHPGRTIAIGAGVGVGNRPALGLDGSVYYTTTQSLRRWSPDGRHTVEYVYPGRNGDANANPVQVTSTFTYAPGALFGGPSFVAIGDDDTVYAALTWRALSTSSFSALDAIYAYRPDGTVDKVIDTMSYRAGGFGQIFAMAVQPGTKKVFIIADRLDSNSTIDPVLAEVSGGQVQYVAGRPIGPTTTNTGALTVRETNAMQFGPDGLSTLRSRGAAAAGPRSGVSSRPCQAGSQRRRRS